ncbi:AsmA-like C-terminal domain-containing protein [Aestuariivirga sp.]|uniref:YhdP family protein n=1 Tax=Aestuariivirga sp. TaxID=2650926 RepID=UPI0039E65F66
MRRRLLKITAFSVLSVCLAVAALVGAFYLRLSQGPVSLNFMTDTIRTQINRNLSGMAVDLDGAVIEREAGSGIPHFRLRNVTLKDAKGNLLARAPRAAIGIEESALFRGSVVPKSIELIGPRIFVKRGLDGRIELGFGNEDDQHAGAAAPAADQSTAQGKADLPATDAVPGLGSVSGRTLIAILAGGGQANAAISTVEDIRVTQASIRIYDEANDAIWNVPDAELAFRRMPYGFAVVTNAQVANGRQEGRWRAEVSASYKRDTDSFSISARISDLVPANISDEIFALSQLARVKVPLSGHAEIEVTGDGLVKKASAEFAAAAGEVALPDYFADPIIVDEGSLRADYDPGTGGIIITDSVLLVGNSQAELTGNILPVRSADGHLTALAINLSAHNVAIDTQDPNKQPVAVDKIDFSGVASIAEAKLDIKDLVVMSGQSGVRLLGVITGGSKSAGILLSGRIRDLSADLLKRLWPPIMSPGTRKWVNQNVHAGTVTDGSFQINLPVDALAAARASNQLPDGSVDLQFAMEGVNTSYFKGLAPLANASGDAHLKDNAFDMTIDGGDVTLPSGATVHVDAGSMSSTELLAPITPTVFQLRAKSNAQGLIEYLDQPDLALISNSGIDSSKLGGNAVLDVTLNVPLQKDIPPGSTTFSAKAKLTNASLKDALPKIDITGGTFDLAATADRITASGPAKINGVDAKISWAKEGKQQSAILEATLDSDDRKKMGIDLSGFLTGTIGVKAVIADLADPTGLIDIDANLSKAAMRIDPIGWSRDPTPKTTADFNYLSKGDQGRKVQGLVISGPDLLIKGDIALADGGGIGEAKLSTVQLSDENRFALTIKNSGNGGTSLVLSGDNFDARPLIKSMFTSSSGSQGQGGGDAPPLNITANVDRIYANRGEVITGVSANIRTSGGRVQAADISGTFLSGQPVNLKITPTDDGRQINLTGRDGGAALRAANLYSKIAGGQIEFIAFIANDANSSVRQGQLVLRNFEVRNEAALAQLDSKGKPKKSGPRNEGVAFTRLKLPFTTDARFVRIGDSILSGNDLGATASGLISKVNGTIDITGTIIPAYALNSALSNIPLIGDIVAGGKGQGVIGLTFALGGQLSNPQFQVNPASAIAPGIFRKIFEFGNAGDTPSNTKIGREK